MVGEVGNGGLLNGSKVCFIDKKIPEDGWQSLLCTKMNIFYLSVNVHLQMMKTVNFVMYILSKFEKNKTTKIKCCKKKHFKWHRIQASVIQMSQCFQAPRVLG